MGWLVKEKDLTWSSRKCVLHFFYHRNPRVFFFVFNLSLSRDSAVTGLSMERREVAACVPIEPFAILEPLNPSIRKFYASQKSRWADFTALRLWKGRPESSVDDIDGWILAHSRTMQLKSSRLGRPANSMKSCLSVRTSICVGIKTTQRVVWQTDRLTHKRSLLTWHLTRLVFFPRFERKKKKDFLLFPPSPAMSISAPCLFEARCQMGRDWEMKTSPAPRLIFERAITLFLSIRF